jgi:quercetin dioxygenase-like cupin family protein
MSEVKDNTIQEVMGYFGNIWVKSHILSKTGDSNGEGHSHHFDHVTLLIKGSVQVEVEGGPPKEFHAPTFIVIKKEKKHKFTALEDDTVFYCVFALRDIDGEPIDELVDEVNTPYYSGLVGEVGKVSTVAPEGETAEKLAWLKGKTITEVLGS